MRDNRKGYIDTGGYHRIDRYTRTHRHLMEQHLGRKLDTKEHVHHINGNKLDNRIENMEVISASEHSKLHPKKKEGRVHKCIICGKAKYYSKCAQISSQYRCKPCYESVYLPRQCHAKHH